LPLASLRTWQGEVGNTVKVALEAGYRHIDCAWIYQNEHEIGAAINDSGLWSGKGLLQTSPLTDQPYQKVQLNLDMTLESLKTDYLDLYLMHWSVKPFGVPEDGIPSAQPWGKDGNFLIDPSLTLDFVTTWRAMETLVSKGKVRAIGVSNFSIGRCKHLLRNCRIKPVVNQVGVNWTWPQHELLEWSKANNILVEANSPLRSNKNELPLSNAAIMGVAAASNVEPAQVVLGWLLKRGVVVLTKSVPPSRIQSNLRHEFRLAQAGIILICIWTTDSP
ncbi:NADP-dependent oxidoreductase domain-containing protein, partial [Gautieria morchelliformis]